MNPSDIPYDLSPLGGLRTAESETPTPPTRSAARIRMDMCGNGVGEEEGVEGEDQVGWFTIL